MTFYVIAGNRNEADQWIKSNIDKRIKAGESPKWNEYYYVSDVSRIKGISNPHGVFVGTWQTRDDIRGIVETLMIQSSHANPALGKILTNIKKKHKKLNTLTPVPGGWINESLAIDNAANLLAKAMDEEVLKTLMQKVNQ